MSTSATSGANPTTPSPERAAWPAVWALALGVVSLNASEMLPMSLLTPMATDLAVTEGLAGQAVSASAIVAVLTSLFIAPAIGGADRRRVLLVLTLAQVVSNLGVALAPSFAPLMVARLALGIAVGGFWGLSASLALRLVPKPDVPKALSIIFGGGAVAGVAAAPLGAFLGGQIGWRGVFLGAAVLAMVALVTQVLTLPSMPATRTTPLSGLWHTLRLPQIALGMLAVMLMFGGRQTFATYLRPFLEQVPHFGVNGVSLTLLALGIANFVGATTAAPLLKRNLRSTLAVVGATQGLLVASLLVLGTSQIATIAVVAGFGFAVGMTPVGWSTWLTRTIPDNAESGGGILVAAIQGSMLGGAVLGGAVIDTYGVTGILVASSALLLIASAHTLVALRPSRT
ncbi:major facilitator superfamily transporter [Microlunatus phosphovorus NM-1]|uniref:Major facilitator superfamily transporter n=1 Tax=Microlunatus phosphovorus (strain ATCC 700054 / DSM 10555 / JCM 9379 / NBRC 101784 / NCIMB 13414 / VKM Ac-1990 / NM-1) TaxID=1032480 RepID=F5XL47_MICPN|nr:MFS transporter [Microlunatus phosphovorus]BAK33735.1 major facilitator superfamily transporter [Microlunatus phosphovorus NM-1]